MDRKLAVSSSPHIHAPDTTQGIMLDVIIALMPATIFGCVIFGYRALLTVLVTVGASVLSEFICRKAMKRENTIDDLSAVVTGLLLALNLPPLEVKYLWIAVIGAVAAIVVVKQMFGGLGNNFVNPAIAARIILLISFPAVMTTFYTPFDAVTAATPLVSENPVLNDMFFGFTGGCIGETSVPFLLLGGIYLVLRRVIDPIIPVSFIGTAAAISFATALVTGGNLNAVLYTVCGGGLMLGAIFMATDYVTSPTTRLGKLIFGIGCGAITMLIRSGSAAEGVSFSIILMNILTPQIDRLTARKPFGWEGKKHEEKN